MAKDKKTTDLTLNELMKSIDKDFGAGSITQGRGKIVNVDHFSTRVAALDQVMGIGGVPIGRIIEIFGRESGGKTTTTLQIIKACQKHFFKAKNRYGVAAFIDAEHALDVKWAANMGVDLETLLVSQPDSGEQAFDIVERLVDSGLVDLIVVDSVAALTPSAILEGEITDANIGALASMMSKGLGKIKGKCNKTGTTVIFINQIREKIGVMFGSPEQTPGGRALKFYASIRMEINRVASLKEKDDVYAVRTRAKTVKNKVAAPYIQHEYDICLGKKPRDVFGIDEIYSLLEVCLEYDVIRRKGNSTIILAEWANGAKWAKLTDTLGQGREAAVSFLKQNEEYAANIAAELNKRISCSMNAAANIEIEDDGLENGILDGE